MTKAYTNEEYINICSELHNNVYDYSLVQYKNQHSVLKIICPFHGQFTQRAASHIVGKGCRECASASRPQVKRANAAMKFVTRALLVSEHQDKGYSYHNTIYRGARVKLIVNCPRCGDFEVTPNNHLRGRGCSGCNNSGYNKSKAGFLYILTCNNITKIGITNKSPEERQRSVSRSFGSDFTVLHSCYFEDGKIPYNLEFKLLQELRNLYKQPEIRFDGFTECFYDVNMASLLNKIESLIKEQNSSNNQAAQAA